MKGRNHVNSAGAKIFIKSETLTNIAIFKVSNFTIAEIESKLKSVILVIAEMSILYVKMVFEKKMILQPGKASCVIQSDNFWKELT